MPKTSVISFTVLYISCWFLRIQIKNYLVKIVSVFQTYVKVYIKAAVLNNDCIFHEKPLQRSSTENFKRLICAFSQKKNSSIDVLLGIYQYVNDFGKYSFLDRQRK